MISGSIKNISIFKTVLKIIAAFFGVATLVYAFQMMEFMLMPIFDFWNVEALPKLFLVIFILCWFGFVISTLVFIYMVFKSTKWKIISSFGLMIVFLLVCLTSTYGFNMFYVIEIKKMVVQNAEYGTDAESIIDKPQ